MISKPNRINRAHRIATWSEIQSIYYTATLTAFFHRWAISILSLLIPSAMTLLQFLAALNRSSRIGYAGCAVAYELLAPQIAIATRRACSVRTLERGIAALKKLGLIRLTWWTMPENTVRNGPYEHKIGGTGVVKTANGYRSKQIRVITLTRLAISLWDRSTAKKGCDVIPHFAPFITSAKMADRSQKDQVGKPTIVQPTIDTSDTSTCYCKGDPEQGQTTRPSAVEQQAYTPTPQQSSPDVDGTAHAPPNGLSSKEKQNVPVQASGEQKQQKSCPKSPRGCSLTPPPIPKNSKNKTTWTIARAYLLAYIHQCLTNYSTHQADMIFRRAEWETSTEYPGGIPTIVDWPYWISRFALLTHRERRAVVFRDILPLLRTGGAPVPNEPNVFSGMGLPREVRLAEKSTGEIKGFLKHLFDKFAK